MKTFKNERDVKKEVKRLLDNHKFFWFCPPANAYGRSGIADILALRSGVFLAIESKFGPNRPTAQQIGFLNSVRAESGFAFVVSDRNLEHFSQWLLAFDRSIESTQKGVQVDPVDGSIMLNAIAAMTELL